ncbi:ATP-binding protein [Stenotrophomonas sp. PS02300]|uniref:ATP-binding protein n=2 Tax=Gammaproteobacteria TaxID=1236 RepID=UPI00249A5E04|nr:ATP-binding protein [Stenotrophomonas sp. PS02300]
MSRPPRGQPVLRWWWLLLVAGLTWFVGSYLFVPWLNPVQLLRMQRDRESMMLMQQANIDMMFLREEALSYWLQHERWPQQVHVPGVHDREETLVVAELPQPFVLRLRFTDRFPANSGLRGAAIEQTLEPRTQYWRCRPGDPAPPSRWLPANCHAQAPWGIVQWLSVVLWLSVLGLAGLGMLWYWVRPAVADIVREPQRLLAQPLQALPVIDRQLGWLRLKDRVLAGAGIATVRWRDALRHLQATPMTRALQLAARIGAIDAPAPGWALTGLVREWTLPDKLPLALERLWLYQPDPALAADAIVQQLRAMPNGQDVVLVVSPSLAVEAELAAYADDPANLCVCLGQAAQTRWLLQPGALDALAGLLARQLRVTRISPYQTHGGITRPAAFFGRESLLARVLNREPGNYLLVGGRQLGKTSLMKAIERRFVGHPRVHCVYLSLRDHRLTMRLALELGLAEDTGIDALVAELSSRAQGRGLLLLIDETDLFLRAEAAHGYPQLAALRALSEEGRCHFMLAGFWDLYEAVTLDFASPLRNFGEVIHIGGLEQDACLALATEPMARLGVHFASPDLPQRLVAACGRRANLVAIACQQLLGQLDRGQRVLDATQVHAALVSEPMFDALAGWARLSPDPLACRIDRIVVYQVAGAQLVGSGERGITLVELLAAFDAAGARVDPEQVRHALARLQLAYVVRREADGLPYVFAVPVFVTQFQREEVQALLQRELQALAAGAAV